MGDSFTHKLIMTIVAAFAAACLFWFYRHIVLQGMHETGEGWKEMFQPTPVKKK